MQLYTNSIQDRYGNSLKGAQITVRTAAGALATLYSDNGVTLAPNPLTADSTGEFAFYAANGRYTFTIAASGMQSESVGAFEMADSLEVIAQVQAIAAAAGGAGAAQAAASATASEASRQVAVTQAGISTTQAGISTTQAGLAATAKTQAETARDAANANGKIYATTSAGLAAAASGGYFSTPSPDSAEYLILYLNNAGVAVEQKRYPSTAAIAPFIGSLYKDAAPDEALTVIVDAMKTVLAYIDSGGDLWLLNMPDSVQRSVALLKSRAAAIEALVMTSPNYAEPHVFLDAFNNVLGRIDSEAQLFLGDGADSLQRQIATANDAAYRAGSLSLGCTAEASLLASDSLRIAAQSLDDSMLTPAYLRTSFLKEATASSVWRFPTLLRTARNAITMLFCEINSPYVFSDNDGGRIMALDLTLDERSKTIASTNLREVVSMRAFIGGNGAMAFATNYSACRVRYGPNKGRLIVIFASNKDAPSVIDAQKPYITYSDNAGTTWSAPVLLASLQTYSAGVYSQGSKAIQLKFGANRGRIVAPLYVVVAGLTRFVCAISNDYGSTWALGTPVAEATNEAGIAEDVNGDLYASVRKHETVLNGYQTLYKSTDGGTIWVLANNTFAGNPDCQASMVQASEDAPRAPKLLRAYVKDAAGSRVKLTVGLSYDGWTTASTKELEWDTSAYSAIEMFNEQDILIVYEGRARAPITGVSLKSKLFNINHIKG